MTTTKRPLRSRNSERAWQRKVKAGSLEEITFTVRLTKGLSELTGERNRVQYWLFRIASFCAIALFQTIASEFLWFDELERRSIGHDAGRRRELLKIK